MSSTPRRLSSRSGPAAVLVSLLVAALAACSGDDGDGAADTSAASTVPAAVTTTAPTSAAPATDAATTAPASTAAGTTAVPEGDDFYLPPDPLPADAEPGDLLRSRPFTGAGGSPGWQLLYVSEDLEGNPVAVSGVALAPAGPAPAGRRPVLTWANGTVGMDDPCTESKKTAEGGTTQAALLGGAALANDWVVVATDYQGIGTPGLHPYLVGGIAGRNVLDAARAVEQIPETGASSDSPVLVWGHSQGGHSAVFAGELAAAYAPELDVRGVVAGAPPGDLPSLLAAPVDTPQAYLGFIPMILAGYETAYPDLDLAALLTDEGRAAVDSMEGACVGDIIGRFAGQSPTTLLTGSPAEDPEVGPLLEENSAGRAMDLPLLVYHGDADDVVAPVGSEVMADRYCEAGVTVQRTVYPGADHTSVVGMAAGDIQAWMRARLAGEQAPSSCP